MTPCVHHWLIDPPQGPLSRGRCIECKEVRLFRNSAEDDKGALVRKSIAGAAASHAAKRARIEALTKGVAR